jgi:hypothetical protein
VTKKEAAEKVAKLGKLSRGTTNPHEAAAAKIQAEKIVAEHGLSSSDLDTGEMGAAFDDLVDQIGRVASKKSELSSGLFDTRSLIEQVLTAIKDIGEADKVARLRQIVTLIRTAAFIAGDNKTIAQVKTALDAVLKNHQLTL